MRQPLQLPPQPLMHCVCSPHKDLRATDNSTNDKQLCNITNSTSKGGEGMVSEASPRSCDLSRCDPYPTQAERAIAMSHVTPLVTLHKPHRHNDAHHCEQQGQYLHPVRLLGASDTKCGTSMVSQWSVTREEAGVRTIVNRRRKCHDLMQSSCHNRRARVDREAMKRVHWKNMAPTTRLPISKTWTPPPQPQR